MARGSAAQKHALRGALLLGRVWCDVNLARCGGSAGTYMSLYAYHIYALIFSEAGSEERFVGAGLRGFASTATGGYCRVHRRYGVQHDAVKSILRAA
jgi:hypothetical protein